MITYNSILNWEKLRLNFPLTHSDTVCATSRLVLSVTSSIQVTSKDLNLGWPHVFVLKNYNLIPNNNN